MNDTPNIDTEGRPRCTACGIPLDAELHCSNRQCARHAYPAAPPEPAIESPTRCSECLGPLDAERRCTDIKCFRHRPHDGKPISDPPKLVIDDPADPSMKVTPRDILIDAKPVTIPVTVDQAAVSSRIEEAVQAAAGTVTLKLKPGSGYVGPPGPGETVRYDGEPVAVLSLSSTEEPVSDNPQRAAYRAILRAVGDLRPDDARLVLAAANSYLELN